MNTREASNWLGVILAGVIIGAGSAVILAAGVWAIRYLIGVC